MATDYGRDVSCTTSLRTGRLVSGRVLLAEAAFRRLTTPRGSLIGNADEANYGIDLLDLIGQPDTRSLLVALPGQIRTELLKDERFIDVTVTVTRESQGPVVTYNISITIETDDGPFALRLSASEVDVQLLGIAES